MIWSSEQILVALTFPSLHTDPEDFHLKCDFVVKNRDLLDYFPVLLEFIGFTLTLCKIWIFDINLNESMWEI